jgi:predicted nucleic-acid-binding protein
MIAVDTNIVVRFLMRDDPEQYRISQQLFSTQDIFVSDTVILETGWVLRYAYKYEPGQVAEAIKMLCGLSTVHLQNPECVADALVGQEMGLDFADAFHLAQADHCVEMLTFDRRFAKRAKQYGAIPVRIPD